MAVVSGYQGILSGQSWNGAPGRPAFVTYSFDTAVASHASGYSQAYKESFQPLTAAHQVAAEAALNKWAAASGVTFLKVQPGEGDIRFGEMNTSLYNNASGYARYADTEVDDDSASRSAGAGDVVINSAMPATADLSYLLLHEIGHALGLKHPFDGDPTLSAAEDNRTNTVMSYTGPPLVNQQLMPFDLQAIAYLYGPDGSEGLPGGSWSWDAALRTLTQTGSASADRILGVATTDRIDGGDGADHIAGFEGGDVLNGGDGADFLFGGAGDDTIIGGPGDDLLCGGSYAPRNGVIIENDGGIDVVDYSASASAVFCKLASAYVPGRLSNELGFSYGADIGVDRLVHIQNAVGGLGNDALVGDGASNVVTGGGGNDYLFSHAFNADGTMKSGAGNDALNGSDGDDGLFAGDGTDILHGGAGADGIVGGAGNDTLNGDAGDDFLFGGFFTAAGAFGTGSGDDSLYGGDGGDSLYGFDSADVLAGADGDDYIDGGAGGDGLNGGAGNDYLLGGDGSDAITGGGGFDYLYGGGGGELFIFNRGDSADWILDFSAAEGDRIQFTGFSFANFAAIPLIDLSTPGNPAMQLTFIADGHVDQLTIFGATLTQLNAVNVLVA